MLHLWTSPVSWGLTRQLYQILILTFGLSFPDQMHLFILSVIDALQKLNKFNTGLINFSVYIFFT